MLNKLLLYSVSQEDEVEILAALQPSAGLREDLRTELDDETLEFDVRSHPGQWYKRSPSGAVNAETQSRTTWTP